MRKGFLAMVLGLACLVWSSTASGTELLKQLGVAYGAQGNHYLAAWQTNSGALQCALINAGGVQQGSPLTLSSEICYHPSVAYDSDLDRYLVVWSELDMGDSKHDVKAQIVTSAGTVFGSTIVLANDIDDRAGPKVAYSSQTQRYFVAYSIFTAIKGQYVNGDGALDGSSFDAIAGNSIGAYLYATLPAVAYDSVNSRFLVLGVLYGSMYPPVSVCGVLVNDSDSDYIYAGPFSVVDTGTYLYPPAVAFNPDDEQFLAIWEVYTGSGHYLAGQIIQSSGSLEGSALTIVPGLTVAFANDITYKAGDGRYLVAWLDGRDESTGIPQIYGQEVAANGTNYDPEFLLVRPGYQYDISLTYNPAAENTLLAYGNSGGNSRNFLIYPQSSVTDLSVWKQAKDQALLGTDLTYTITVSNEGGEAADNVVVTDTLPSSVMFVSADSSQGTCEHSSGTVTCNLGTLASGAEATITVVVTTLEVGSVVNFASVASSATDTNPDNDTAEKETIVRSDVAVNPAMGTTGTVIDVETQALGASRGKIALVSGGKPYTLKVISWNEGGSGIVRAVVSKPPAIGECNLFVQPKDPKGAPAVTFDDVFTISGPVIVWSPPSGSAGDVIPLAGHCFGTKRGKVYVEYSGTKGTVQKSCKVLSWPADPDDATQFGIVQISVPSGIPIGDWTLVVDNKVGKASVPFTISN